MAGEARKTTARRGRTTTRTKKVAPPPEPVVTAPSPIEAPSAAPPPPPPPTQTPTPATPTIEGREWVPVVYEGDGVFSDSDAGVFVTGTRTRLRPRVAARLLRFEGFRIAA